MIAAMTTKTHGTHRRQPPAFACSDVVADGRSCVGVPVTSVGSTCSSLAPDSVGLPSLGAWNAGCNSAEYHAALPAAGARHPERVIYESRRAALARIGGRLTWA